MVTLIPRLYKMGCLFCIPKSSDDSSSKNPPSHQTSSKSGKYTQNVSRQSGNVIGTVQQSSTKSEYPEQSINPYVRSSTFTVEPQLYENIRRAPGENVQSTNPNLLTKVSVFEGSSSSKTTSLRQYNPDEIHHNRSSLVHEISEGVRIPAGKYQSFSIHSLPATRFAKSPVDYHRTSTSSEPRYDWYSHTNVDTPQSNIMDLYGRNPYTFLTQSKTSPHYLTTEHQYSRPEVANVCSELYSEALDHSSDFYGSMESNSSLKRDLTSLKTQSLEQIYTNQTDECHIGRDTPSSKRFKDTHQEKESLSYESILTELECRLRERYDECLTPRKVHSFYFEVWTREESGSINKKFCTVSQLFPSAAKWRMLVYGKPFFGKTQLCEDVTRIWHASETGKEFANIRGFKILVHHSLIPESVVDLKKYLVGQCHKMLLTNVVTKSEFKSAWSSCMLATLFVLDGYDSLNDYEKRCVGVSLRHKFFEEASVLLVCRPDVHTELRKSFSIHADICAFSKEMLLRLTNYESQHTKAFDDCKVESLVGISPIYAQAVAHSFTNQADKPESLYELLNSVIHFLSLSTGLNDSTFNLIGKFFLEFLKCRCFVFEEEILKSMLHNSWQDLQSLGLFVACPSKPNETRKLVVSHKILLVYFSVRYLRENWRNQKVQKQRDLFLNGHLCFPNSSGVYVSTKTHKHLYFAGTIPEIVFDFHNDVFQMIQDVSELDLTSVFETQSLLLRVDTKHLHKFGITEVDSPDIEDHFVDLLNILDFWGLTIDKKCFVTSGPPVYYLKIAAIDEEADQLGMMSVASVNPVNSDQIQEVYLDFLQSNIKVLHSFLQKFAEKFFGSCEIDSDMSAVEMVLHLVLVCLTCHHNMYTQLVLGSRSPNPCNLVTWEVMSSSGGTPTSSFMYVNEAKETVFREFDSWSCHHLLSEKNRSKCFDKMNMAVSGFTELGIQITLKRCF